MPTLFARVAIMTLVFKEYDHLYTVTDLSQTQRLLKFSSNLT